MLAFFSSRFSQVSGTWLLIECFLVALVVALSPMRAEEAPRLTSIACVGDSITQGAGTDFPSWESYPAQLQRLLGNGAYAVGNYGVSGSTLLNSGDQPYQLQKSFKDALGSRPDIVIIQLGTNDTKPKNWAHRDKFADDYRDLVRQFRQLTPRPRIYLSLPPCVTTAADAPGINEAALREAIPLIEEVAREFDAGLINVHGAFADHPEWLADHVHPNARGATALAKVVFEAIIGRAYEGEVPTTLHSRWNGYERLDFTVGRRPAIVVAPRTAAPHRPWIWRTEFFGAFPSVDVALLAKGWHIAYLDVQNLYGAPAALDAMEQFPQALRDRFHLASKPVIEGFSRGGLFAFNWAVRHPDQVAALYVDAPVCDFKSWPGGKGRGKGSPGDWARCLKVYGLTEEQSLVYPGNPVDNLQPLAAAGIPIVAVAGDADDVVPLDENIGLVVTRYRALGGEIALIVKHGVGHHPHSLEDPLPVVDFLVRHQAGSARQ